MPVRFPGVEVDEVLEGVGARGRDPQTWGANDGDDGSGNHGQESGRKNAKSLSDSNRKPLIATGSNVTPGGDARQDAADDAHSVGRTSWRYLVHSPQLAGESSRRHRRRPPAEDPQPPAQAILAAWPFQGARWTATRTLRPGQRRPVRRPPASGEQDDRPWRSGAAAAAAMPRGGRRKRRL